MNRWMLGVAVALGALCLTSQSANAQYYSYAPSGVVYAPGGVYSAPVIIRSSPVVTSAYYAPSVYAAPAYVAPSPVVQMAYSVPATTIVAAPVYAAPVYAAPVVRHTVRATPFNYTEVVRTYGPTVGPHYSRVHVHHGLFGTTVRERVR